MLCDVWVGACVLLFVMYICGMGVYLHDVYDDGWSPVMDDSIDACMFVCVFSVFLLYIIIILSCKIVTLGQ